MIVMTEREALKFIYENREQLERFASNTNFGRVTREQIKNYEAAYRHIDIKAPLCFTCGRSAQLMGQTLLAWAKKKQPRHQPRRKK